MNNSTNNNSKDGLRDNWKQQTLTQLTNIFPVDSLNHNNMDSDNNLDSPSSEVVKISGFSRHTQTTCRSSSSVKLSNKGNEIPSDF